MIKLLVTLSCVMLAMTVIPLINDAAVESGRRNMKQWVRLYSLCMVAVSSFWLTLAIWTDSGRSDLAVTCLLLSTAVSWVTSPWVTSWWRYVAKHNSLISEHNHNYGRRASDKEELQ